MILLKEDYNRLTQIQLEIAIILKHAVMSELEEVHERKAKKKLDDITIKSAFAKLLKEIKRMPDKLKEIFNEEWFLKHLRQKSDGIYEIRCSIDKIPYSGSGKTINIAVENFISDIAGKKKPTKQQAKKILFNEFAEKWFVLIKKPTVKANTFSNYYEVFTAHIAPYFKNKPINGFTAMLIQPLLLKLVNAKKRKTASMVKILLSQIFQAALNERLIDFNPMDGVQLVKHESKKSSALTMHEERSFLAAIKGNKYELAFLLLLFCGMRRGELKSAKIEGGFIVVADGKLRVGQIQTYRKIPITPMLAEHLSGISKKELKSAIAANSDVLSKTFKKLCVPHHLHELRHTFITRCQECGVPREVVSVWAGHAADKTMTSTVYTHFSEEFMLQESKKVNYFDRLY